jgi:oxygen-independent coproporphyrinogen-3 oxidase
MHKKSKEAGQISNLGMYIHVPFCSTTCDFCAFYQQRPSKKGFELFFKGLKREMDYFSTDSSFSTIFIGGGTPGLLGPDQIIDLGEIIRTQPLENSIEWSVEIAPSEITAEKLKNLKEIGVNRISLGVQTFDPQLMKELGRDHEVDRALKAYQLIREAGFLSVNIDLLFGAPGQSLAMWEEDLMKAVQLDPDHISTYCLTFEEDTALFVKLSEGKVKIDPEKEAAFYETAWEFLPQQGFPQYEVSNYAKPGKTCLHNLNTWAMNDWVGYGPSAASQVGGVRRKNLANLEEWAEQWERFGEAKFAEFEKLQPYDLASDAILFGLRMNQGINLEDIGRKFQIEEVYFKETENFFQSLEKEEMMEKNDHWKLTTKGRILADAIAKEIPFEHSFPK